jgi:hypothetical protein
MAVAIVLIGLSDGNRTPHDGRYLKAYDPTWLHEPVEELPGVDRFVAVLESTANIAEAKRFATLQDAILCRNSVSPNQPVRPDGRPNRPLTAFTMTFEQVP